MKKHTLLLFALLIFSFACKKEETRWDTAWEAPLVHGHLTINDMIPVEYTETNADDYLSLVIHEPVFGFSLDTLIQLPDTTVQEKTAIGVPSIEVTPSFVQPSNYDQELDLGDIKLRKVIIRSGTVETKMVNTWPGKTSLALFLPNVTNELGSFNHIYYMDAGSEADPSSDEASFDMANYHMDLRGIDENLFNSLGINVVVQSNEETDNYIVTDADTNVIGFTFKDMIPQYAMGYFGQYTFADTMTMSLPPLKNVVAGTLDLDSIDMVLTVKNGFNLIAQAKITKLTGINTRTNNLSELEFPQKNTTLNIDPASGGLYDYVPSEYPLIINNTNSNMISFLENLSDSILVGYEMKINPFGNITGGADEFFPNSKMELFLDGEFPMNLGANNLTIQDTLDIDWENPGNLDPNEVRIVVAYENGFPMGAASKFYLLDDSETVIDSIIGSGPIQSGIYAEESYTTTASAGQVTFLLDKGQLESLDLASKIILRVAFDTHESAMIKVPADAFFDFNVRSNLNITIAL